MHERLKASIKSCPIIDVNGYPYLVHPITDGIPLMDPDVLDEIIEWMISASSFDCDCIAAPESMGIPLAVPLSLKLRVPYTVIRKRPYNLKGEIKVSYKTGYSDREIFINGLKKGDKVVIVDDLLSTGGTLAAIITALKERGVSVEDVLVIFNKCPDTEELSKRLGVEIKRMLDLSVDYEKVTFRDPLV
jgi:adenine phosphoribosyltransferase